MGRLDTQKGIERLYGAAMELRRQNVEIDWRIIGSEVVSDKPEKSWTSRFEAIGIPIRPPIYSSDKITEELANADVLVLPSRWEGAPLTILEAQRLGCVPIAAAVGATGELIEDGVDGTLLKSSDDWALTLDLAAMLQRLSTDRDELTRLSVGAAARTAAVSWKTNVSPLVRQLELWFPKRWNADAHSKASAG
jgi:glycosyltransferase involved in cell wall biosynthesis